MVHPAWLLYALIGVTIAGLVVQSIRRRRQAERIRTLARGWRMNFSRGDSLRLTGRIAGQLPVPGAAALREFHVVYGIEGETYRYVFTIEYTLGVTGPKRRFARVATFTEPRDRRRGGETTLTLGDEEMPLIEQYAALGQGAYA
jgi:hypothetical protein